ncbi:MAG: tetratricopeptide repeat protein [Pyrinomonadaceae bacterium]
MAINIPRLPALDYFEFPAMCQLMKRVPFLFTFACAGLFLMSACGGEWTPGATASRAVAPKIPAATPLDDNNRTAEAGARFLEDRVKHDPEDFSAHNKLAAYYLQRARETGSFDYLDLAARAAKASLASVPSIRNAGGLAALAQTEYATHDFAAARDHARQLIQLDPAKSYPYAILGDALLELGDYDGAVGAYQQVQRIDGGISNGSETRQARLAFLRGDTNAATRHFSTALIVALNAVAPSRETVAWCRWQLGEVAFATGDYQQAEKHYRDALVTFPDYYRALASLARVRAAQNDLAGAIENYRQAIKRLPDPSFIAALGDLYKVAGKEREAMQQYTQVEQIARLSAISGALYNRQLALFYADHELKAAEAYEAAMREYEVRRDIYGADALAWTAFKAGHLAEAQAKIKEALRLGTKDARLFYHAGMIAKAAGDERGAKQWLEKALQLNPQFDPLLSLSARHALLQSS